MNPPTDVPRGPTRQLTEAPTGASSTRPADPAGGHLPVRSSGTGTTPVPHTLAHSLVLHLAPGVAVLAAYALLIPVAQQHQLPSAAALAATGLLAIAPVQLTVLAVHRRRHPHEPAVQLRQRLPVAQLLAWACLEIVLGAVAFQLMAPLTEALRARLGWWPTEWGINLGNDASFSRTSQLATAAVLLVGTAIVAPIVEEVYFRGYLLPRMPQARRCTWRTTASPTPPWRGCWRCRGRTSAGWRFASTTSAPPASSRCCALELWGRLDAVALEWQHGGEPEAHHVEAIERAESRSLSLHDWPGSSFVPRCARGAVGPAGAAGAVALVVRAGAVRALLAHPALADLRELYLADCDLSAADAARLAAASGWRTCSGCGSTTARAGRGGALAGAAQPDHLCLRRRGRRGRVRRLARRGTRPLAAPAAAERGRRRGAGRLAALGQADDAVHGIGDLSDDAAERLAASPHLKSLTCLRVNTSRLTAPRVAGAAGGGAAGLGGRQQGAGADGAAGAGCGIAATATASGPS